LYANDILPLHQLNNRNNNREKCSLAAHFGDIIKPKQPLKVAHISYRVFKLLGPGKIQELLPRQKIEKSDC
jgi:hypothetical protein